MVSDLIVIAPDILNYYIFLYHSKIGVTCIQHNMAFFLLDGIDQASSIKQRINEWLHRIAVNAQQKSTNQ